MLESGTFFKYASATETYDEGETIVSAGDKGDCMYIVKSGKVNIVVDGNVVETVEKNGIFGELSLIDHDYRSASAVGASVCQVVKISERQFFNLVKQSPEFALEVMAVVARRLRNANATHNPS